MVKRRAESLSNDFISDSSSIIDINEPLAALFSSSPSQMESPARDAAAVAAVSRADAINGAFTSKANSSPSDASLTLAANDANQLPNSADVMRIGPFAPEFGKLIAKFTLHSRIQILRDETVVLHWTSTGWVKIHGFPGVMPQMPMTRILTPSALSTRIDGSFYGTDLCKLVRRLQPGSSAHTKRQLCEALTAKLLALKAAKKYREYNAIIDAMNSVTEQSPKRRARSHPVTGPRAFHPLPALASFPDLLDKSAAFKGAFFFPPFPLRLRESPCHLLPSPIFFDFAEEAFLLEIPFSLNSTPPDRPIYLGLFQLHDHATRAHKQSTAVPVRGCGLECLVNDKAPRYEAYGIPYLDISGLCSRTSANSITIATSADAPRLAGLVLLLFSVSVDMVATGAITVASKSCNSHFGPWPSADHVGLSAAPAEPSAARASESLVTLRDQLRRTHANPLVTPVEETPQFPSRPQMLHAGTAARSFLQPPSPFHPPQPPRNPLAPQRAPTGAAAYDLTGRQDTKAYQYRGPLTQIIKQPPRLVPAQAALAAHVQSHCTPDQDNADVLNSPLIQISLKCPLTLTRIAQPVRLLSCRHVQCFDFRHWAVFATGILDSKWMSLAQISCPVCGDVLANNSVVIEDAWFRDILDAYANQPLVHRLQVDLVTGKIETIAMDAEDVDDVDTGSGDPSDPACISLVDDGYYAEHIERGTRPDRPIFLD